MSYENIALRGLGNYANGEAGCTHKEGCSSSKDIPSGLSVGLPKTPQMLLAPNMGFNEDIRQLCNLSAIPASCYVAKAQGKNFMGRGDALDPQRWQNWVPAGTGVPKPADALPSPAQAAAASASTGSSTWLYVGLGTLIVAGAGVAVWKLRKG